MESSSNGLLGQLGGKAVPRSDYSYPVGWVFAACAGGLFLGSAFTDEQWLLWCAVGACAVAAIAFWGGGGAFERTLFFSDRAELHTRTGPPRVIARSSIVEVRLSKRGNDEKPLSVQFVLLDGSTVVILGSRNHRGVRDLPYYGAERSARELTEVIETWRRTAHLRTRPGDGHWAC